MRKQSKWEKLIHTKGFDDLLWIFFLQIFWVVMMIIEVVHAVQDPEVGGLQHSPLAITAIVLCGLALVVFGFRCGYFAIYYKEARAKEKLTHEQQNPDEILYKSYALFPEDYNILIKWKNETKVRFMCVKTQSDGEGNRKLIIYTDRPGLMIGYHGETFDRYKEQLCGEKSPHRFTDIEFFEVNGFICSNTQVDVDDFYLAQSRQYGERF